MQQRGWIRWWTSSVAFYIVPEGGRLAWTFADVMVNIGKGCGTAVKVKKQKSTSAWLIMEDVRLSGMWRSYLHGLLLDIMTYQFNRENLTAKRSDILGQLSWRYSDSGIHTKKLSNQLRVGISKL